jgi:hypothetical protein
MPTETVSPADRAATETIDELGPTREEALRTLAIRHRDQVVKFRRWAIAYVVGLLVLTPVWIVTEYTKEDGWPKHLSSRSRYQGDWDPWIIWVALVGAVILAIVGLRAYFGRTNTEDEIERELERLKSAR